MDEGAYFSASEEESVRPAQALQTYQGLIKENKHFFPVVIAAGVLLPALAYCLAVGLVQFIHSQQKLVIILVITFLGYGPLFLVSASRDKKLKTGSGRMTAEELPLVLGYFIIPFVGLIQVALALLITAVAAFVLLLPVSLIRYLVLGGTILWPAKLPHAWTYPVMGVLFIFVFIWMMSDVQPLPFSVKRILKEIPIGLRHSVDRIAICIVSFLWICVAIALRPEGTLNLVIIGAASLLLGAVLGLTFAQKEQDWVLGSFLCLASARCLLHLDKTSDASFLILARIDEKSSLDGGVSKQLGRVLLDAVYKRSGVKYKKTAGMSSSELNEYLDEIDREAQERGQYLNFYDDSIRRIRALVTAPADRYGD